MAPAPVVVARIGFGIFNDPAYTVADDPHRVEDVEPLADNHASPLRTISSSNNDNRQPRPPSRVESLAAQLEKLHIGDSAQVTQCKGKAVARPRVQPGARVTRPAVTADTFAPLEIVTEDEQADSLTPDTTTVPRETQRCIELPADRYAQHPLAIAARVLPPAAEQFAKQRNGDFEWVLTVQLPAAPTSGARRKLFFGCNLLPVPAPCENDPPSEEASRSFTLLATPLEGTEEPLAVESPATKEATMALAEAPHGRLTPVKAVTKQLPAVRVEDCTPAMVSKEDGSFVSAIVSKVPAEEVEGIEAIDRFEEEMEAFELAAGIKTTTSPAMGMAEIQSRKVPAPSLAPTPHQERTTTPQPKRHSPGAASSGSKSSRRPSSMMLLDSLKLKGEDKALARASSKKSPGRVLASLQPPKLLARYTKAPTVAAFELPGDAVARRLNEQRAARLADPSAEAEPVEGRDDEIARFPGDKHDANHSVRFARREEKPAAPAAATGLRRAKSTRAPTLPRFELPGEVISRRKREEHDARLKAREEEERKRRQFKARPVRIAAAPSTVPRETIASRARQNGMLAERQAQDTSNKRASAVFDTQPRGRHAATASPAEHAVPHSGRATSSSAGSTGKRSSVSLEEVHQQRARGKDIFQRDNAYTQDRTKERRDREAMARAAREEAAERSRQQGREWAEKQKRKRMTVGSIKDVTAA